MNIDQIKSTLVSFKTWFMNDDKFRYSLSDDVYGNSATKYILHKYNNNLDGCRVINKFNEYKKLEVEHIKSAQVKWSRLKNA
ncbi:hypothetical protein GMMP15_1260006 [Candidatus Magnetomoraceae bacterium gMMP-15]